MLTSILLGESPYSIVANILAYDTVLREPELIIPLHSFLFVLFCFAAFNLIGHLMLNQVNENKSEKKFKVEVLGINDKF